MANRRASGSSSYPGRRRGNKGVGVVGHARNQRLNEGWRRQQRATLEIDHHVRFVQRRPGGGEPLENRVSGAARDDRAPAHQATVDPVDLRRYSEQPILHVNSLSQPGRTACKTAVAA